MLKKIINFAIIGIIGILIPNIVSATTTAEDFNVEINFKSRVSSQDFVIEYCSSLEENSSTCKTWTQVQNITGTSKTISLRLVNWDVSNNSWVNHIRISKNPLLTNYATKNYTILYENARITNLYNKDLVYNFLGDDDSTTSDDVDSILFSFSNGDIISNETYKLNIYPELKSFGWNFPDVNALNYDDNGDNVCDSNCDFNDDGEADLNKVAYNKIANGIADVKTPLSEEENIIIKISEGAYLISPGTNLTIQLLPYYNYQLGSLNIKGINLTAGQESGYYNFIMPNSNFHFKSVFNLNYSTLDYNGSTLTYVLTSNYNVVADYGNFALKIRHIYDDNIIDEFNRHVANGNVIAYLNFELYNYIWKGDMNYVWSTKLDDNDLSFDAEIFFNSIPITSDTYIIYEDEGEFHTISSDNITFNANSKSISFTVHHLTNYAIVSSIDPISYTLKSGENNDYIISFQDFKDEDYEFNIEKVLQVANFTDEELLEYEIPLTHEEIMAIYNRIINDTSSDGELIELYEMSVDAPMGFKSVGPFYFKVKLTDELKDYKNFKLIYYDDSNNCTGEKIMGIVNGDYIDFELDHLSMYAMVGTKIDNPKTNDDVINYIILGIASLAGIYMLGKSMKAVSNMPKHSYK